jgi:anti-sigma B factor antagonist
MSTPASLAIAGELTIFSALPLKERLLASIAAAPDAAAVDVDLSDVTEIDTAGLQLMLLAKREANLAGKNVRFVRHSDAVLDLIDLCDLAGHFGDPVLIRSHA